MTPDAPKDIPDGSLVQLCEQDAALCDALLEAGLCADEPDRPIPVAAEDTQRCEKLRGLLRLMAAGREPVPDDDTLQHLCEQTMARVRQERQRERFAAQVSMLQAGGDTSTGPRRLNWRQFAVAASVGILCLSLLAPVLSRSQADALRLACMGNLNAAAMSLGHYAADFAGLMPRGLIEPPMTDTPDANPGAGALNGNHLLLLVRHGCATPDQLVCPAGEQPDAADAALARRVYSFQSQFTPQPVHYGDRPDLAALADRNPLFIVQDGQLIIRHGVQPSEPSRAHAGRGQNVLLGDGSARWTLQPVITDRHGHTDNIWVRRGGATRTAASSPADEPVTDDSFLIP
jgi:hypothetical protein